MPTKKYPQISVSKDTYNDLQEIKFEVRARSLNEAIRELIEVYRKKTVTIVTKKEEI